MVRRQRRTFVANIRRANVVVLKPAVKTVKDPVKSARGPSLVDAASAQEYSFGPFRLDVAKRRVWRGDQLVPLTRKAFDTLLALLQQAGQVVDKEDLLQTVWPDTFVTEETVTQNIATIRRALGDSSERPEYIATIPRRGYQFIGVVRPWSTDFTPSTATSEVDPTPHARRLAALIRQRRLLIGGALMAMISGIGLGVAYYLRPRLVEVPLGGEWQINPPPGTTLTSGGVLSPDGQSIAFVTIDEWGTTALWVQTLGALDPLRLPGTEHARTPFWSPDAKAIVFVTDRKLKRIGLTDKTPQILADIGVAPWEDHGGAWSSTGALLCSTEERGPLYRLKADGTFEPGTRIEAGERVHLWPSFLPDGRHFLYRAAAFDADQSGTYLASLDSLDARTRLDGVSSAAGIRTTRLSAVRARGRAGGAAIRCRAAAPGRSALRHRSECGAAAWTTRPDVQRLGRCHLLSLG
jgi:DNA-binding winged helix-turn-helix (wHTH) protein